MSGGAARRYSAVVDRTSQEERRWPAELIAMRHAQSIANAAFAAAHETGIAETGLMGPDADVPLSPRGREEAILMGRWLAGLPRDQFPHVVMCSPYTRAVETWEVAFTEVRRRADHSPILHTDERLRDRKTGVLELLTPAAVRIKFPEEIKRRSRLGEVNWRPEGGESLADVRVRVESMLADLTHTYGGRRIMLVTHDAVVLMLRQIIDGLSTDELLCLLAANPVRNTSITRWEVRNDRLHLCDYNFLPVGQRRQAGFIDQVIEPR